ncbi:hypothetical protein ACFLZ4_00570 [Patescibacteria group bacterium]
MQGIYVGSFDKNKKDLLLKLNPDFIWAHELDEGYSCFLKENGIKVYYPIGVFGISEEEQKDGFSATRKDGKPVETYAGWYRGGCPSNTTLRKKRLKKIKMDFETGFYDGVWLDSIRFPTYWETKKPSYLDTCYCDTCLEKHKSSGMEWEDFRISQITSFLNEVKKIVRDKPLGYFAVPETEERLHSIFAQPAREFEKIVDYSSPMIYPQMIGKNGRWIKETLKYFKDIFGKDRVIPILQVVKMPDDSNDKFEENDLESAVEIMLKDKHISYFMLDQLLKDKKRQKTVISLFRKGEEK